jgi:hypothetical protein
MREGTPGSVKAQPGVIYFDALTVSQSQAGVLQSLAFFAYSHIQNDRPFQKKYVHLRSMSEGKIEPCQPPVSALRVIPRVWHGTPLNVSQEPPPPYPLVSVDTDEDAQQ